MRLNPAEILIQEDISFANGFTSHITHYPSWHFEFARCEQNLKNHFEVNTLEGFGLKGYSLAIQAGGAILDYLKDTQPAALKLLSSISVYAISEFMNLDAATRRNLELTETIRNSQVDGSLLSVLDHTITPMGHRLIRQWVNKPLLNIPEINKKTGKCRLFL